ncbi:MAG: TRAP transporter substrate-binding protein [Zoogloeaceae bacterium]|uniref:TRAP transporter substrate-binding protein n=1 Tax=Denitromonas sp. TaxID=2734609 RepID=UPI001DC4FC31|nr:TRAP transporter substrate-binding protein [Rhodocyclaceae bacterium]MCP5222309.1 TRAP transporter substrate-binding protein [Zoogloeaceae bacterium]HQU89989.1 TRAP transporter substrate-binding protein [Denitromonas sp.]
MKKTLITAAVALLGSTAAMADEPIILKVAHFWPPTAMSQQKVLEPWCAKIEQESAGRMKCQIYPAMQLGGTPPQLIQQAQDGVADIVWTLPGYTAGRFPSMEVFELPFMTNRAEPASRAAWQYYEQFGKEDFANVKPLAFHVHDEGYVHNNKHPITKMSDFRGLKMRAPTRMTNKMIAAFGATPVAMPMPAVAEAVSKGVVDGYVLPWEVIPAIKLHELTKFHSETDKSMPSLYTALFIIAMNPAKYDSLPDDLKKVIDANSGADFSASIGKAWDESAPPAREKAVAHGNAFATISVEELSKWRKVGDKLSASWAKEMDGKGYKGQAMLDTAKALIQKANAQ